MHKYMYMYLRGPESSPLMACLQFFSSSSLTLVCFSSRADGGGREGGRKRELLTLGTHVQRGLQYLVCVSVCLSVCLSVTTFSAATRNETVKKRYQRVQCHTDFIFKMAILVKMLRSKVMA